MKRIALVLIVLAVSAVTLSAQRGRKPVNWKDLPAPFATPSVRNNATIIPRPEGATLTVPPGFVVEEFMDFAGMRPRFMTLGPGNEILISDTSGNGNVFVIKDGVRTAIIEKLDRPYGLALKGDQLYVAEPTSIKVYTYDAKTMKVTGPGKEIISLAGMVLVTTRARSRSIATARSCICRLDRNRTSISARIHCARPCIATTLTAPDTKPSPPVFATPSACD